MPRLAWLTDLHFDAADEPAVEALVDEVAAAAADAVLIGGDVSTAKRFDADLRALSERWALPVHFVLGNHDYYRGSVASVRNRAELLSRSSDRLHWLPVSGIVSLSARTALVGHGGWGDARSGRFESSDVVLNDFFLIEELRLATFGDAPPTVLAPLPSSLRVVLNRLGDEAAAHFERVLPEALASHEHVVVLTHVPPFREACWHEGRVSDDMWAPHFVCAAAGEVIRRVMAAHPDRRATVLCGHTHSPGVARVLPNLEVLTGAAEYGAPVLQRIVEVG